MTPPPDAGADAGVDAGVMEDAGVPDAGVATLRPVWAAAPDAPIASGLWGTVLSFDPVDRRFILHGGNTYPTGGVLSETWSYSIASSQWTKLDTMGDLPPVRYCHCAAYLPDQRQVLIAGGRDSNGLVDSAYTLDLMTLQWTQVTGTVPTGAIGCTAHWMPNLSRAIVFGGDGPSGVNDKTWAYEPTARTFTELMPPVRAAPRRDAMSIYEPVLGGIFMFGGAVQIRNQYLDDLAMFDGTTWVDVVAPSTRPSPRRYGASGYDAQHAKWLLFSGTNDFDDFDDLWVFDPGTFEFKREDVTGGPPRRAFSASGIDEVTGTLYVFGGLTTPGFMALADGWTLRLE